MGLYITQNLMIPEGKRALIHENKLVIADLHLGYEGEMENEGVYLPRLQLKEALKDILDILQTHSIGEVVIAGDLKHRFQGLSWQERSEIEKLVNTLRSQGINRIVLVKGNHDTFIKGLMESLNVKVYDTLYELGDGIAVTHGHLALDENELEKYEVVIIGHEHPATTIRISGSSIAKFPTFLYLPLDCCETRLLVLPAFGVYQSGNPVSLSREGFLSPLVRKYGVIENARPYISDSGITIELPELKHLEGYVSA
ncbi:MAG: metallophosphoesterase [Desulfurococcales archaeon]|nr:metallophosphoesterase [Desulfurococcales archaeon]